MWGTYKSNIRRSSVSRRLDKVKAAGGEVSDEMKEAYEATAERELSYKEPVEVLDDRHQGQRAGAAEHLGPVQL